MSTPLFRTIIFLVGFLFCVADSARAEEPLRAATQQKPTAVAQKEAAASKPIPDIDALAELGKLSEGDILIIEHSLAALYYYPNELTGKPSQKLVEALQQYQKDEDYRYSIKLPFPDKRQIEGLWNNALAMGGLDIFPLDRKSVRIKEGGNRVQAAGLWSRNGRPLSGTYQEFERIACFKDKMMCYSSTVNFYAKSGYAIGIIIYKIEKFDSKKIIARSQNYINSSSDDDIPELPLETKCIEARLEINMDEQKVTSMTQKNQDMENAPQCTEFKSKIINSNPSILMNQNDAMRVDRYDYLESKLQSRSIEQKKQLLQMLQAGRKRTKAFYESLRSE